MKKNEKQTMELVQGITDSFSTFHFESMSALVRVAVVPLLANIAMSLSIIADNMEGGGNG